jgi:hypothetical protein
LGIASDAGARIMQGAGFRLPDALVRKQFIDLINKLSQDKPE